MLRTADAVKGLSDAVSPANTSANANLPTTLDADFSFVPKPLAEKCRRLIDTYHAMNGYTCLPDMSWQPELRDFIEMYKDFRQIFKRSSSALQPRAAPSARTKVLC
jgi:hypothetical protein